jgi:hypothetical protein
MIRPRPADHGTEPSLVPLADMLTNTVGIMLFILIFTVLATAGATVIRRFPIVHEVKKHAVMVICAHGKIYPVDLEKLGEGAYFDRSNGNITRETLLRYIPTKYMDMQGVIEPGDFYVQFMPRTDSGDPASSIADGSTEFVSLLRDNDPNKSFIFYLVTDDSIDTFLAARQLSQAKGFEYGWSPIVHDGHIDVVMLGNDNGAQHPTGQ